MSPNRYESGKITMPAGTIRGPATTSFTARILAVIKQVTNSPVSASKYGDERKTQLSLCMPGPPPARQGSLPSPPGRRAGGEGPQLQPSVPNTLAPQAMCTLRVTPFRACNTDAVQPGIASREVDDERT